MSSTTGIRAGRAYVELGYSDKLSAGLRRAQRRLQAFASSVKAIGTRLVLASAAAATPLALSAQVFASFEQKMARVQALTGATGTDFTRLADEAKRLGESTVFSASQAADAMSYFALAGYKVDEILQAIGPTLNLAAAGQLEIAQAADIAAKIMAGMGLETEQLGYALDVLTKAMTTANTDLPMLGDAMKYVGPIAKSAGIAFEEVVAAVQLLSNAGIQGEMAGTTLRGAILSLTSPSQEARETLQQLGVSVVDSQGNVRSLAAIIADLNRVMAGMGSGQKLDILGRIFQARQAAGVAELLSQGADQLRAYTAALQDAGGTAARIAGVQLDTLQGDATILKSALEGLGIAVGEGLVGPLRAVIRYITGVVGAIATWVRENRALVATVAMAVVTVGGIGAALVTLGVAAQAAAFVLGGLTTVASVAAGALTGMTAILGGLLSPIGLVVAAVAGLGGAILLYTDAGGKALAWLGDTFAWLRGAVQQVVGAIGAALASGDLGAAAQVLWAGLRLAWEEGTKDLRRIWDEFRFAFERVGLQAFFGLRKGWAQFAHWWWRNFPEFTAAVSKAWTTLWSGMKSVFARMTSWLSNRWLEILGLFDEDLDVDLAQQLNAQELNADLARIEADRAAAIADANRKAKLSDAERAAELRQELTQLEQAEAAALENLEGAHADRIQAAAERLRAARAEWQRTVDQARAERGGLETATPAKPRAGIAQDLPDHVAQALGRQLSISGTFNALVARQLGGGRNEEVRVLHEIRDELKAQRREARKAGGKFTT